MMKRFLQKQKNNRKIQKNKALKLKIQHLKNLKNQNKNMYKNFKKSKNKQQDCKMKLKLLKKNKN